MLWKWNGKFDVVVGFVAVSLKSSVGTQEIKERTCIIACNIGGRARVDHETRIEKNSIKENNFIIKYAINCCTSN
jgi:hypothetical protein